MKILLMIKLIGLVLLGCVQAEEKIKSTLGSQVLNATAIIDLSNFNINQKVPVTVGAVCAQASGKLHFTAITTQVGGGIFAIDRAYNVLKSNKGVKYFPTITKVEYKSLGETRAIDEKITSKVFVDVYAKLKTSLDGGFINNGEEIYLGQTSFMLKYPLDHVNIDFLFYELESENHNKDMNDRVRNVLTKWEKANYVAQIQTILKNDYQLNLEHAFLFIQVGGGDLVYSAFAIYDKVYYFFLIDGKLKCAVKDFTIDKLDQVRSLILTNNYWGDISGKGDERQTFVCTVWSDAGNPKSIVINGVAINKILEAKSSSQNEFKNITDELTKWLQELQEQVK